MANSRTNDLKVLLTNKFKTLTQNVYFEQAADSALYPHIVFDFREIDLGDINRQDYVLEVDIWTKGTNTTTIDELADSVEDLLQAENLPQTRILPTFYKIDRRSIIDQDKTLKHRQVRFQIQNYKR